MSRMEIGLAVTVAAAPGCGFVEVEVTVDEASDFVFEVVELIMSSQAELMRSHAHRSSAVYDLSKVCGTVPLKLASSSVT